MLEKIGLPPKPSLRGNNWVADASHCQGCSSQFTFINRKHHCRRCGGLFCNSCTQQRMVLRGQGDSPVRICEPCKKLEEAARFELRQGRRAGKGSLKSNPRYEDEVLNQILGHDRDQSFSSGNQSTSDTVPNSQRSVGSASSSSTKGLANQGDGDLQKIFSNDNVNNLGFDMGSTSPDELRQRALEEKKKYKILKGDGKPEEALRAFKRGKELERQAGALEVHLRKTRKKISSSGNLFDEQNRDIPSISDKKTKSLPHMGKEKHDLNAELRELGWSDLDLHDEYRKSANLSLEGELSSIIGEITRNTSEEKGSRIDKTQVVALKKKALMLKREGKLAEAKEELKRAKLLEKQLEEQELLAEAEDSDDELSALIRGMDNDEEGSLNLHDHGHGFDIDNLLGISDNLDGNFEVTDEDMMDPEIAVALESLGWTEESNHPENTSYESQPLDTQALHSEIQSLKREALKQKREGNAEEAMACLKKAKLLERDLNSSGSQEKNIALQISAATRKGASSQIADKVTDFIQLGERNTDASNIMAPKSRLMIQKELLSLKKKALALRREGKLNEAEQELRKGEALERQLEDMNKASNLEVSQLNIVGNVPHSEQNRPDIRRGLPHGEREEDVTDQELSDPTYLSLLRDLGWNDDNNEPPISSTKPSKKDNDHSGPTNDVSLSQHSTNILVGAPRRSKFEIQRELLGLKRKALALRREGKVEDAEEVLKMAKELESKVAEMEAPKKEVQVEANKKDKIFNPSVGSAVDEGDQEVVTEDDMHDPALNSMLLNLGWKDEGLEHGSSKEEPVKKVANNFIHGISGEVSRSKSEIQRELLLLKRKALALKRKGEMEEAEEILRMAKSLEAQMEDIGIQKKEFYHSISNYRKPDFSESSKLHEKHGSQVVAMEVDNVSATSVVGPLSDVSSLNETNGYRTSAEHSLNSPDLLTGDGCSSSDKLIKKQVEESKTDSSMILKQGNYKSNVTDNRRVELTDAHETSSGSQATADQDYASKNHVSFHQEILAHKRKAVALKREGKLMEAREELRQAKLLEKSLENNSVQPNTASNNISTNSSNVELKKETLNTSVKPLSSRDRFKLQQESLGHKRQALKLRREGRMEEAEAEFEQAKALEMQLEELTANDSGKSSASMSDTVEDVIVEDFLDPQLLSALKAVGLEDVNVVSKSPEKQDPVRPDIAKIENVNQERIQLEERIKAEKVKAVNLKRSGKQTEALDALRRAKMYEKKLNSMRSG
ncbi:Hepatocyte growth factor-regulated tyrosine kinase substrate [Senna tora]|uniref:Hepatocyte growth factor-regulated tyrosine kinase substrate n=1 Tax=Senna tora TaxID=362788 RepID=A0A834XDN0_9FABA|nr:Hepatocyte growth factor-regulated tyrosine kinase substrate [Senna tora]